MALTAAIAELLAAAANWFGLLTDSATPIGSLGEAFIAIAPNGLVDWAKNTLGSPGDKIFLGVGIGVTLLACGALTGIAGRRRRMIAARLLVLLAVVPGAAILTRRGAGPLELLPLALGVGTGCWLLLAGFRARTTTNHHAGPAAPAVAAAPTPTTKRIAASAAGAAWEPRAGTEPRDRRRVLQTAGYGALGAVIAGVLSRLIPANAASAASRAGVTLPTAQPQTAELPSGPSSGAAPSSAVAGSPAPATAPASGTAPVSSVYSAPPPSTALPTASRTRPGSSIAGTSRSTRSTASSPSSTSSSSRAVASTSRSASSGPSTFDSVSGISPYVTTNKDFYRIDISFVVPQLTTGDWSLRIHGMVAHPYQIGYVELSLLPQIEREITLTCVSNPLGGPLIGNARWLGTLMAPLIAKAKPLAGADCLLATDATGYTSSSPLDALTDGRDAILAIGMNGEPLPIDHGFPVRMVVPGLYGYVSATKWVVDWEITQFAQVSSYWTRRGWSDHGPVKTSSRIDVPRGAVAAGMVTVAGVAWAQHRGIAKVQVQVDGGRWADATLSRPISKDTWVQWVFQWKATRGSHMLRCRAVDGTGALQIATDSGLMPDGATGYDMVSVIVP